MSSARAGRRLPKPLGCNRGLSFACIRPTAWPSTARRSRTSARLRMKPTSSVTSDRAVALAVQVADCVPLLLGDPRTGRVAAAHAGWRGTAANAAGVAAAEFEQNRDASPTLVAALGPSIGPCCYRVGPELRLSFEALGWPTSLLDRWFSARAGGLYLDLWQANTDQLLTAGVAARDIHVSTLCTACHPDWFCSYRRDGPGTGRMVGFICSAKC